MVFVYLKNVELAKQRVAERVKKGGHNIEPSVIERRYHAGLKNLKELYIPKCDDWMIFDNSTTLQIVAQGNYDTAIEIYNSKIWNIINENG